MSSRSAASWWQAFRRQGGHHRRGRLAERRAACARARCRRRPTRRASSRTCWRWRKRENFRVNVIEAFDEPWKRALEGTVGGHWGLLDDATRAPKFVWGEAVSNHPLWRWQAAGGILFALLVFGAAFARAARRAGAARALAGGDGECDRRRHADRLEHRQCAGRKPRRRRLAALAGAWSPSHCWRRRALSAAIMRGTPLPRFSRLLGPAAERVRDPLALVVGAHPDRDHAARDRWPRSAWCSIRATGIFRSRR